ncbi:hypothetical protein K2P47_01640 [Patescibacteria group bacterium]|nr:hypothetical protein [Patescibacteria group bacterium]
MPGCYIDDALICEAYIWALDKYRNEHTVRGFRPLADDDFNALHQLRAQLGREWSIKRYKKHDGDKYYPWRSERLDVLMVERNWTKETRDLYASMLSTLQTWSTRGQNQKTKERLKILYPGASLLLQFLDRFPPQLTTEGKHDALPL